MSNELKILKLFCDSRDDFIKGEPYVSEIKNLEREIRVLLSIIKRFYTHYEKVSCILHEDFRAFYDVLYPGSRERETYFELIGEIFRQSVSNEVMKDLLEQIIEQHYAAQIMFKLTPIVSGAAAGDLIKIQEDLDSYAAKLRNPPSKARELSPFNCSLNKLVESEMDDGGLRWFLPKLNDIIGGVKRGTLGAIFAFVDAGKTSFGIKSCVHFASQLAGSEVIVYAGNEEASPRISFRMAQAALGKTKSEISNDIESCENRLVGLGYNKILLYDSITHTRQLEKLLDSIRPRVLFIDQGTKVRGDGGTALSEVGEAQYIFNWYRERAKLYNTSIICLVQAVGEAENRKYLKLSDIYGSRVSIQGELDYAIGIGRTMDDVAHIGHRFINVPKNKMKDGLSGKFITEFINDRCDFKEI